MNTYKNIKTVILFLYVAFFCFFTYEATSFAASDSRSEWTTGEVHASGLSQHFFYSELAKTNVSFHIYMPKSYEDDKEKQFPVIYWLHGHSEGEKYLSIVSDYFKDAMDTGKMPQALVVFPNGMKEGMWCDSKDGKTPIESIFINELIPYIDKNFRTIPDRSGRLIEGFSMGGYGAARLGIKYNNIFSAISILGAGPMQRKFSAEIGPANLADSRIRILENVYGNDQEYFTAQSPIFLAEKHAGELRNNSLIRIAVGDKDVMQEPNKQFSKYLSRLLVPHNFYLVPEAAHNPITVFRNLGENNWKFYRSAFANYK